MNDMKEFWNKWKTLYKNYSVSRIIIESMCEEQGLFFWERGGKQFVKSTFEQYPKIRSVEDLVLSFETAMNNPLASKFRCVWGQDFLDALDCLGEGEIEKRIDLLKES